jgi:hypothetical protein
VAEAPAPASHEKEKNSMTITTIETITAASAFVRAEVALRASDREVRTANYDLIGVDPDDSQRIMTRLGVAATQAHAARNLARAALLAAHADDQAYAAELEKENARHARAIERIARRHAKAVVK